MFESIWSPSNFRFRTLEPTRSRVLPTLFPVETVFGWAAHQSQGAYDPDNILGFAIRLPVSQYVLAAEYW
jgi:hypothetical protein